jgi:predicted solute-binding protein
MKMKKVYIVGNHSFIFGVFKSKSNAIVEKQQRRKFDKETNIYIKKRVNKMGYSLDD